MEQLGLDLVDLKVEAPRMINFLDAAVPAAGGYVRLGRAASDERRAACGVRGAAGRLGVAGPAGRSLACRGAANGPLAG